MTQNENFSALPLNKILSLDVDSRIELFKTLSFGELELLAAGLASLCNSQRRELAETSASVQEMQTRGLFGRMLNRKIAA